MSVLDKVQNLFGDAEDTSTKTVYECNDCGNTFESYKPPEKVTCMECVSSDVEQAN